MQRVETCDAVYGAWIVLAAILLIGTARAAAVNLTPAPADAPLERIDPNTAPWWELTLLPRIGEGTARKIVRHRQRENGSGEGRLFRRAADLTAVRGIGPKTVTRIAPHLRF